SIDGCDVDAVQARRIEGVRHLCLAHLERARVGKAPLEAHLADRIRRCDREVMRFADNRWTRMRDLYSQRERRSRAQQHHRQRSEQRLYRQASSSDPNEHHFRVYWFLRQERPCWVGPPHASGFGGLSSTPKWGWGPTRAGFRAAIQLTPPSGAGAPRAKRVVLG